MLKLTLNDKFDPSQLETGDLALGYKNINLVFNVGPLPGGGDCLLIEADGKLIEINSNELIHDLAAYI